MEKTESSTKIVILANKVEDTRDLEYLSRHNIVPDFVFEYDRNIKHARQKHQFYVNELHTTIWQWFLDMSSLHSVSPMQKLHELHNLHKKYIELDYIKQPLWDISHQIDSTFTFPWK